MTDSMLERTAHDASSPRAQRLLVRVALRGLVVAGIAGGAWLLSSSAAHAAEGHAGDAPVSTGAVTSLVTGLGGNGVDDILRAGSTVSPTTTDPLTRILTPSQATTVVRAMRATDVAREPAGRTDATGTGATGLTGLADALVAPTGLDRVVGLPVRGGSGSAAGLIGPVDAAGTGVVSDLLSPPADVLPATAHPVTSGRPVGPAPAGHVTPTAGVAPAQYPHLTAGGRTGDGMRPPSAVRPAVEQHAILAAVHPAGGPTAQRYASGTNRVAAISEYRTDRADVGHGPFGPRPAPTPVYPDPGLFTMVSPGTPTPHHGGSAALAFGTVIVAPDASRRSVPAVEVEALRLIAEAPTVSPD
jgi:hypothetical protein